MGTENKSGEARRKTNYEKFVLALVLLRFGASVHKFIGKATTV